MLETIMIKIISCRWTLSISQSHSSCLHPSSLNKFLSRTHCYDWVQNFIPTLFFPVHSKSRTAKFFYFLLHIRTKNISFSVVWFFSSGMKTVLLLCLCLFSSWSLPWILICRCLSECWSVSWYHRLRETQFRTE